MAQFTNTCLTAFLIIVFSAIAVRWPNLRWVNTALAVWVLVSATVIWSSEPTTLWNNVVVGALVFVISLVRGEDPTDATPHGVG
jgi:hypothetical protein